MNRYDATGHEAEEQPGAEPGVLRNLPGLTLPTTVRTSQCQCTGTQKVFE
jgi:hypothetical protein